MTFDDRLALHRLAYQQGVDGVTNLDWLPDFPEAWRPAIQASVDLGFWHRDRFTALWRLPRKG